MKRTLRIALGVTIALILGQWLAIVHEGQHPLSNPAPLHCSICLQAHNLGYAGVSAKLSLSVVPVAFSFTAHTQTAHHERRPQAVNNRGPPRSIVI